MLDDATSPGWVTPLQEGLCASLPGEPRLLAWSLGTAAPARVNPGLVTIDRGLLQSLPGPLLRLHR
ncbi:MAG: hypothetical protein U0931_36665, partial [Vulcanimicrobiota bacterium]